jgi:hypothetical protein
MLIATHQSAISQIANKQTAFIGRGYCPLATVAASPRRSVGRALSLGTEVTTGRMRPRQP